MRTIAFWLSLIFIFTVPWENMVLVESNETTGNRLIGILLAVSWLAAVIASGRVRRPHAVHFAIVAFLLWNLSSAIWSVDNDLTRELIETLIQMAILSLILWDLYTTKRALRAGLQAFVLGGYVAIASTIINYVAGTGPSYLRYAATGFNVNDLGITLALGIAIAWYLALTQTDVRGAKALRILNYCFLPAATLAILLTASRAAVIATIPAFIFVMGSITRLKPASRALVAGGFIGILIAIQAFIPQSSIERLATIGTSVSELDLGGRVEIWSEGLEVFAEHPLVGVGSGAFNAAVESGRSPHNTLLSILVETGPIGLLLFVLLAIVAVQRAIRPPIAARRMWVATILVWLIGSFSVGWAAAKPTWMLLSLIVVSGALPELQNRAESIDALNRSELKDQFALP